MSSYATALPAHESVPLHRDILRETFTHTLMAAIPLLCLMSGSPLVIVAGVLASGYLIGAVILTGVLNYSSSTPRRRSFLVSRIPIAIAIQCAVLSELIGAAAATSAGWVSLGGTVALGALLGVTLVFILRAARAR